MLAYMRALVEAAKHIHDSRQSAGEVGCKRKTELMRICAVGRKWSKPCPYQVVRENFKNDSL